MKKKKWGKRKFVLLGTILAIPLLFWLGVNLYTVLLARNLVLTQEQAIKTDYQPDAILVLGAGVLADGSPSVMLEERLLAALDLYENNICRSIIVSGDHQSVDYDEVNVMKEYLIQKGVPGDRIFMDHAGFSTYDSLYRAQEIFGAERLLIVSQRFHTARAVMIAKHLGISCRAVAADSLRDCYSGALVLRYELRETLARCKDFVLSLIGAEPTYLGEPISLLGSGDITNDSETEIYL